MPQLDVYIICNMLYCVIFAFVSIYIWNLSETLMIINIILRIRKLKLSLDKKYINNLLKEIFTKVSVKFLKNVLKLNYLKLKILEQNFIKKDFLDIFNIKKNILKKKI